MAQRNYGYLQKNINKRPGKPDPEMLGQIRVSGRPVSVAAWVNTSANGIDYLTLTFREGRGRPCRVGNLLQNGRKRQGYRDPDFVGDVSYGEARWRLQGWINVEAKALNLSIRPLSPSPEMLTDTGLDMFETLDDIVGTPLLH